MNLKLLAHILKSIMKYACLPFLWQSCMSVTFCLTETLTSAFKTIFQVIYDLLEKSSGHLELREDPEQGITVAGLRCIKVYSFSTFIRSLKSISYVT